MPDVRVPLLRENTMTDTNRDEKPDIPTDSDELAGDNERSEAAKRQSAGRENPDDRDEPNPPHTTRGIFTAPKFGAAGSGGLEIEPGLEKD